MKYFETIVIGSGIAAYRAAGALKAEGKEVALFAENRLSGTSRNTGSDKQTYYKISERGEADNAIEMAKTLSMGGGMDGDIALCEAAGSLRSFYTLIHLGVDFPTDAFGGYVGYKTDHDPKARATSIGPYTSKAMTEALEKEAFRLGVAFYDRHQAVKILTDEEGVYGVIFLRPCGNLEAVLCNNVILATGGPASLYKGSVYPVSQTGATALALEAGATLANFADWQYGLASTGFRWNLSGTYAQVLPRVISVDEQGIEYEFLPQGYPSHAEAYSDLFLKGYQWPFDSKKANGSSRIDLLVQQQTALGRKVYFDYMHNPEKLDFSALSKEAYDYLDRSGATFGTPYERLMHMNPPAVELYRTNGYDLSKDLLPVAVCAQHCNGGVQVDINWQSSVKGLYVCGEAAGTFGPQRPGGSALNSCMVGAFRAAMHVAYEGRTPSTQKEESAQAALTALKQELSAAKDGTLSSGDATAKIRALMSDRFSNSRNLSAMKEGLATLQAWEVEPLSCPDKKARFAHFKAKELRLLSKALANAAIYSGEICGSRGAALVAGESDLRNPLAAKDVFELRLTGDTFVQNHRAPRPVPTEEGWFETVWAQYRAKKGQK